MEQIKVPIKKYWNKRSLSYGLDSDKSHATADTWAAVLNELVAENTEKRALDVGTGTGQFALYLARSGFSVTGIDLSDEMINTAKKNAAQENLRINFKVGDAEHLDYADNSFDVVVSRNLLWTLPDPENAFKEWKRVLRPGGRLVVSDGFWMNTTWKRVHHLAADVMKNGFKNGNLLSILFFWKYSGIQKSLPFYFGINAEDATSLLQKAGLKNIRYHDTSCFQVNPYKVKKKEPVFFIAYADKESH